tara:strand:- start:90 stop:416 length:327 start_codon:yes stop_codon:yes gene_type:complete
METTQQKYTYIKVAQFKLFPNESDNPKAPAFGNGKIEVTEDLKVGDVMTASTWVNQDEQGNKTLSVQLQKKVEAGAGQSANIHDFAATVAEMKSHDAAQQGGGGKPPF